MDIWEGSKKRGIWPLMVFFLLGFQPLSTFSQSIALDTWLVAQYDFNGNTQDHSLLGNSIASSGLTYGPDRFCTPNASLYLDGTQSLQLSTTQGLDNRSYTYTAWIKSDPSLPGALGTLVNIGSDPTVNDGQIFYYQNSGSILGSSGTSKTNSLTVGPQSVFKNQWVFVAVVRNLDQYLIYINGIKAVSVPLTGFPNSYYSPNPTIYIGGDPNHTNFYKGYLDDLHIYNEPLDDKTILAIYGFGTGSQIQLKDGPYCISKPVNFKIDSTNANSIVWDYGDGTGKTNPGTQYTTTHTYGKPGTYVVSAYLYTSCTIIPPPKSTSILVGTCPPPCQPASLITVSDSCLEKSINFNVDANKTTKSVTWDYGDNIQNSFSEFPFTGSHLYAAPGYYRISATVYDTCGGANLIIYPSLFVSSCLPQPNPIIPSAFTPNGDGQNDVWEIPDLINYPKCSVQIFDRWGSLVFSSMKSYLNPFDGFYRGKRLPLGTYFYIIQLKPGVKPLTGSVSILY